MRRIAASLICAALMASCETVPEFASNEELGTVSVTAAYETPPVGVDGDAADDPAIWVNPDNPDQSLVFGTNKQAGLHVYDLQGQELQFIAAGRLNNVDVRSIGTGDDMRHIVGASNRTTNSVSLFEIDAGSGEASLLGDVPVSEASEVYGFCLGLDANGGLLAFTTTKEGTVIVQLVDVTGDLPTGQTLAVWNFDSQLEGCASDDNAQAVFVGEEARGVWHQAHVGGKPTERVLVDEIVADLGLVADVEGLDIWQAGDADGYLVVSAQAADRFVVYDRKAPFRRRGVFNILANPEAGVDGVSHTDGLTVSSATLGADFPQGLLVVQDDQNTDPASFQNFKYIDWKAVSEALGL